MRGRRHATWLLSATVVTIGFGGGFGCSTESHVGMNPGPIDPGGPGMLPVPPADPPFTYPDGVVGDWTGYFQGYTLPSGSDAIALALGQDANNANEIRLIVGVGPVPPPPTGKALLWPPPAHPDDVLSSPPRFIEGYSYVAHQVQWQGKRLRFSVATLEPWQPWCAMQPSYPFGMGTYGCFPSAGIACDTVDAGTCHTISGQPQTISYAQVQLCQSDYCACDAAECIANPIRNWSFDLTFDSDTAAAGALADASNRTFRLMR